MTADGTGHLKRGQKMLACGGQTILPGLRIQKTELHVRRHLLRHVLALAAQLHQSVEVAARLLAFAQAPIRHGDVEEVLLALDRLARAVVELLRFQEIDQRMRMFAQQRLHGTAPGQAIGHQSRVFHTARKFDAGVVVGQRIAGSGQRFLVGTATEMEIDFGVHVADAPCIDDALFGVGHALGRVVVHAQDAEHVAVAQLATHIPCRNIVLQLVEQLERVGMRGNDQLATLQLIGQTIESGSRRCAALARHGRHGKHEQRHEATGKRSR